MTITTAREKSMAFSDPYYYTQGQVIVKQGAPILASLAAMKGKTIGVGTGTTYYDYLNKAGGINIKPYDTDASTFPDLKNGRLNGVMTADLTAGQAISSGFPFVFSGNPYYYEPLAFATEKGQADWVALLDYAVQTMHKDGTLTVMAKKWYVVHTYSGFENKVKSVLEERVRSAKRASDFKASPGSISGTYSNVGIFLPAKAMGPAT